MSKNNFMNMLFAWVSILCISTGAAHAESSGINAGVIDSARRLSEATQKAEREELVWKLASQYAQVENILLQNLHNSCSRDINDKRYLSPLHAAIYAIRDWRIARADDALIEVIDYTLDPSSLPVGLDVGGGFYYPAASSLVQLRVDIRKVVKAIRQADNEKRIRLLNWVLAERLGSDLKKAAEHLRPELEKCDRQSERDNLAQAIGWLGEVRHSTDLLPRVVPLFLGEDLDKARAFERLQDMGVIILPDILEKMEGGDKSLLPMFVFLSGCNDLKSVGDCRRWWDTHKSEYKEILDY